MKTRFFSLVLALSALIGSPACMSVPFSVPTITLRVTGIPLGRNQVVLSCPQSLAFLKVEKIDQWGKETFVVRPGASIGVRASGLYGDQAMALTVYGYQQTGANKDGEPLFTLVGRTSREFRFWDSGNNSGQLVTWDVQVNELR